jgi:Haem-binding domain
MRIKPSALLIALAVIVVGIQLVPVSRINPAVVKEPTWDSPETRTLFMRACGDCHSNESKWPAYSYVAPVSWFVVRHVNDGRGELNVSEFDYSNSSAVKLANNAAKQIERGDMPLPSYLLIHSEAKLTAAEQTALINGLKGTFK